jgi:glycine oxidase
VLQGVSVTGFVVAGDRVVAVQTSDGTVKVGQVVVASGAWTGLVTRWLTSEVPVGPQRGQIAAFSPTPEGPRVAHVVHGPGGYIIPKPNGTACVGATHEFVGFDARVTTYGMKFLADLALRLAPGLETATLTHVWMGFRPVLLREGLPPVGLLPGLRNAYVAAGHGAVGMTLGAGVGKTLAQLIRGEQTDVSLAAFDPALVVAGG